MPLGAASRFGCARTHGKARIQHFESSSGLPLLQREDVAEDSGCSGKELKVSFGFGGLRLRFGERGAGLRARRPL
ncbi:MAG: hypothetical protein BJ554DRAFT_4923 [Olpidium bornovanus]|uniref:Uncharacterized protein n=1 Tax=Olpidium bornovanus TaxID=278681 RepID=A0A8H8DEN6_9FUNG|nr:MAG: hypothetical protein BJ554DRAFT_4923 [Olpidium bornovanus]